MSYVVCHPSKKWNLTGTQQITCTKVYPVNVNYPPGGLCHCMCAYMGVTYNLGKVYTYTGGDTHAVNTEIAGRRKSRTGEDVIYMW